MVGLRSSVVVAIAWILDFSSHDTVCTIKSFIMDDNISILIEPHRYLFIHYKDIMHFCVEFQITTLAIILDLNLVLGIL